MIVSDQTTDALRIDTTGSNAVQIVGSLFPAVFAEGLKIDANAVTVNILTAGTVAGGATATKSSERKQLSTASLRTPGR
ncbi:hypothetical protein [Mameliella alba]|uniref:hypothetical protein n=1 Tax=Mameliella alba TaxID=561184 RepID=UPI0009444ADB|nr:hypothetical protein [Mameliella alba]OWV47453.1 hypothetical protein CDZ96_13315 [Mameliella alba]GGF58212.1 hypothetical protein GCM10011319_19380 [Mameliella alba]